MEVVGQSLFIIAYFVAFVLIARVILIALKAPKRIDELEKKLRKIESRLTEVEQKEKK